MFDVTSVGSTMIRLSVPPGLRLETAPAFDVRTAGSESNTMVALARMGRKTAWISRLTDNALGDRILADIGRFGVDTSRVILTPEGRNETFFVEYGASPRPIQVIYDRSGSAVSGIRNEEIDIEFVLDTRILHLTGILPALSENCARMVHDLIDSARQAGVEVSFDVNYRSKLWSAEQARSVLTPMMRRADILFITREDAEVVFGISGNPEQAVEACRETFGSKVCVLTLGADGGIAYDGLALYHCKGYDVQVIDRLGAGDAFTAGVLCGYLEGSLQAGMDYASAMSALKLGICGDCFVSSREEVLALLRRGVGKGIDR